MDESFDSVVVTMAFSGYPDGAKAISEMHRVLKEGGRLVLVDVNYPANGNRLGTILADVWRLTGDIISDMGELFRDCGFAYTDEEIGGYGSVHLYIAIKGGSGQSPQANAYLRQRKPKSQRLDVKIWHCWPDRLLSYW